MLTKTLIKQEELMVLLNIYLKETKITIKSFAKNAGIGYDILYRFTKNERRLGFNNFYKLYEYLDKQI